MDPEQNSELLTAPEVHFTPSKIKHFEGILQTVLGRTHADIIQTVQPYPTVEFLRYLVERKQFLLHGSNQPEIREFKPRRQTDYEGRMITAVFAAEDSIAPIFYAILDRANYKGSIRNMFKRMLGSPDEARTCYRFSIDADSLAHHPWIEGTVYVFSRDSFVQVSDEEGQPLLEWASLCPVRPIVRVRVKPADFPFLKDVQGHDDRLQILIAKFLNSYEVMQELNNGYAFGYRWTYAWGADLMMLIDLFRVNMPAMGIELHCEPNEELVWLHLRGSTEIKGILQYALEQLRG